jgi:hypothetical protein
MASGSSTVAGSNQTLLAYPKKWRGRMRFLFAWTAVVVALAGCGQQECSPEDVDGTYLVETREISGDCGGIGTIVAQYNRGTQTAESGCVVDYERLSDDQCTAERAVTCTNTADGFRTTGVGSVTQEPGGGSAAGTLMMTLSNLSNGSTVCSSTYAATYTRQ